MSSGSEGDDEYVPEEPEKVSEEESADEDTEKQYENEFENTNKRKGSQQGKPNKKLKGKSDKEEVHINLDENNKPIDPENEKKREDDLWAKFLEGTDSTPKNKQAEPKTEPLSDMKETKTVKRTPNPKKRSNDSDEDREKRIFEFAGETIVVENNVIKERLKTSDKPLVSKDGPSLHPRPAAGLSNIVGQLNKQNKLSTLDKSKLDWNTFKKDEGIEEEITSHNKGKDGYLERQDFLGRTDVRQYEIERDLRTSRRSKR